MEFPFPPPPPGYAGTLAARWVLVGWVFIGVCILIVRILRREFIKPREMVYWLFAAIASCIVASLGYCRFSWWDNNEWLMPVMTGVMSVSVAGIAIGLSKLYSEGYAREIKQWLGALLILILVCGIPLFSSPVSGPRGASPRIGCQSNLRFIGMAMQSHLAATQTFLPAMSGKVPTSWRVQILPQLDAGQIFRRYNQLTPWDQVPNDEFAKVRLPVFNCPSNVYPKDEKGQNFTSFSMLTGQHTVGDNPGGTPIADITDGASNTLAFVEASGAQIVWTEPRDVNVSTQPAGINLNGNKPGHSAGWLSSYHVGGVNVLFADGSARFLSVKTDPSVLKKLATIDGGEAVGNDDIK